MGGRGATKPASCGNEVSGRCRKCENNYCYERGDCTCCMCSDTDSADALDIDLDSADHVNGTIREARALFQFFSLLNPMSINTSHF